jgi:cell division protein FtsQ
MSGHWKHTLKKTSIGLLLAGVLLAAYLLGENKRSNTLCAKINIEVEDSINNHFVTSKIVNEYLVTDYRELIGVPVDKIDLYKIETLLNSKNTILKSEAYISRGGILNINVQPRKPAMKFRAQDHSFFCTSDGYLLPEQPNFIDEILTVEGNIPIDTTDCRTGKPQDPKKVEWIGQMLKINEYINEHPVWKDKIGQIICEPSGELIIKPKEGRETFLFGHLDEIDTKFEKMQIYYQRITADKGDDAYNIVDLRFEGQIVCKDTEKEK